MSEPALQNTSNENTASNSASVATIILIHPDFSIPGSRSAISPDISNQEEIFFDLVAANRLDVIVLDLSRAPVGGIDAILKIRQRSPVPILVVCAPTDGSVRDYQIAGAADCIPAPIDLITLNQALQRIISITRRANTTPAPSVPVTPSQTQSISFAGMTFRPYQCELTGFDQSASKLTALESRLLLHLVSNPWVIFSRTELAEAIYGQYRPVGDRALDVIVNRLRKKMVSVAGQTAQNLIKTEFRRGFMLVSEVSHGPAKTAREPEKPILAAAS